MLQYELLFLTLNITIILLVFLLMTKISNSVDVYYREYQQEHNYASKPNGQNYTNIKMISELKLCL
jgi:diacylglycerol kinase